MSAVTRSKWLPQIYGDTPLAFAARRALKRRLLAVEELLPLAAAAEDPEHVHQLRVATRRVAACERLFGHLLTRKLRRRLRDTMRAVRRAAADARRDDVHAHVLAAEDAIPDPLARRFALAAIERSRRAAAEAVCQVAGRRDRLARLRARVTRVLDDPPVRKAAETAAPPGERGAYTLSDAAFASLPPLIDAVRLTPVAELGPIDRIHALRIDGKRLRYALEVFAGCFPREFRTETYPRLEEFQDRLGEINDLAELSERLARFADDADKSQSNGDAAAEVPGLRAAADSFAARLERARTSFLEWWAAAESRQVFGDLVDLVKTHCGDPRAPQRKSDETPASAAATVATVAPHRRVAAIDVGTNSIRMVVAETDSVRAFRIIDDVKETTRLGEGLYSSGRLSDDAIESSMRALERMRSIAESYHVERLRAVATSAVREAGNGRDFVRLAEARANVRVVVIDAEHEARLAFSSVVSAFDLSDRQFATVDLGGGSAELVFSTGGLIDSMHTLALGAVRLTEVYGSHNGRGEYRYGEMRRAVDRAIAESLPHRPRADLLIGTGGTFTTLARVSLRRGPLDGADGRFPFAVRGCELTRSQVGEVLELLRRLPLAQRRRVPGLSARRAEIIVAGLCVVERLMDAMSVERLRVHDGGIRDGLLAEMVDELGGHSPRRAGAARSALRAVRAFARRSRYDRDHSEHVARLAVRIFDQLAEQLPDAAGHWAAAEHRDLLRAAAILHDVGMLLGIRRHHKHSYDMIEHARLPEWTRREIELIANIARYHRRSLPHASHPGFRMLGDDDQRLVAHLAGVLRIADGLDRDHRQSVTDVVVRAEDGCVRFEACCPREPIDGLKYAARKSDLFEAAFRSKAALVWSTPSTNHKGWNHA